MKPLLRKHIVSALVTFLILVGMVIVLSLFGGAMRKREARVVEVKERLASFEQNKKIFSEEAKQFEVIRSRIGVLEKNIITKESVPDLLSSLEEIAAKEGVSFEITAVDTSISSAPDTQGPQVPVLRIDFSATGAFEKVQSLVARMQQQSYQIVFSRFSLFLSTVEKKTTTDASAQPSTAPQTPSWQLLARIDVISF